MSKDGITYSTGSSSLADILERVLDKGVVIAGDIKVNLADVELLSIKIRLVICSVEKAMQMGINWWQSDPMLSSEARTKELEQENIELKARLEALEKQLSTLLPPQPKP
ncbi:MAG: gas vesicle protein GvpJ [Chloroherpetonaceae bacterium]|nr:gas vesicle protein [Chloroherpetonaceae bacterium]MCS7211356.1 gas vesicle protein [Chloroherpetonaceae bacterium]MDW8018693.1 gas vesicle protein GvpJ [Chloroherpetonaceae bacterium]MDW8466301.1 gas vesicle protein GvpJ [Chloroherpetonaceae bacterium]